MKYTAIMMIMGMAYKLIFRTLLIKAINDPDEEWDDMILALCDGLFNYQPEDLPNVEV